MLIGISGKLQSGKDTTALILQSLAIKEDVVFTIHKFAGTLKTITSMLTGISVNDLEDIKVKNSYLPQEWNDIHLMKLVGDCNDAKMTVREMLQKIGTDCMRDHLHTNVWVNALLKDYKSKFEDKDGFIRTEMSETTVTWKPMPQWEPSHYPNWIITDTRFPNEFQAIKDRGGILIRVNRGSQDRPDTEHASEFALDSETRWDYMIQNDGSLKELQMKVNEIWKIVMKSFTKKFTSTFQPAI